MARVLYVSRGYCTHDRRFLDRLVDAGHEMWFVPCEAKSVQGNRVPINGAVRWLPPLSDDDISVGTLGWTAASRRFRQVVRDVSPDLIHAGPIPTAGFFAALAGFHPLLMMSWGSDVLSFPEDVPVARWMVEFALRAADMVIADCHAVRDRIVELSGLPTKRIVCLPWGVDLVNFRPKTPVLDLRSRLGWEGCKIVISTRAFESIHRPLFFLRAMHDVLCRRDDVRVLMLGDGSLRSKVEMFIQENNLGAKVHLAGQVLEEKLPEYFAEVDLYVSATRCDGSSISLLEAMACGLSAIVVDGYGNKEWVTHGENGWLYPAKDADALAHLVLDVLENDAARQSAGDMNIQITRARADWNLNFGKVLAAYKELLSGQDKNGGARRWPVSRSASEPLGTDTPHIS